MYIFTRLFRGVESEAYKIKQVLFLFAFSLLAACKTLFKGNEKNYKNLAYSKRCKIGTYPISARVYSSPKI